MREQVAQALNNKAVVLGQLGRSKDARATYDELVRRYRLAEQPVLRQLVSDAREARRSGIGRLWHRWRT
jgi:hypothetical protein